MKQKTKSWSVEGFIYDPHDIKPEWFEKMILSGRAFEFKNSDNPYLEFSDKRCSHKAYTGDFVHYDEFGRFDVWSAKHLNDRIKSRKQTRCKDTIDIEELINGT